MTIIVTNDECRLRVQVVEDTKNPGGFYVLALLRRKELKTHQIGINNFFLHLASSAGINATVSLSPSVALQKSSPQTTPVKLELKCKSLQLRSRSAQRF